MENIIITKDFGTGKANAQAKAELTKIIMDALTQAFGEDNVAMVRTGGSTQVNEIGVRMGTITDTNGYEYDFCATINPTIKGFKERVTKRYTVEAFDFETAKACYENDVATKAVEKEAKDKVKADKIAKDKATREAKCIANAKAKESEGEE